MAMIQCKECSKEISDQAETCPNCGCPTNKKSNSENVKTMFCRECGQKIPENSKSCPRCGYEFNEKRNNIMREISKWLIVIVAICVAIIVTTYAIYFLKTFFSFFTSIINTIQ